MPSVNRKVIVNPPKTFGSASEYTRAIQDERGMLVVTSPKNPIQTPLLRLFRTPYLATFYNEYNPFVPGAQTGGGGGPTPDVPISQLTLTWGTLVSTSGTNQQSVSVNTDGTMVLAAEYTFSTGRILLSSDSGNTFSTVSNQPTTGNWYSASASADFTKIVACKYTSGARFTTRDGGSTAWTSESTSGEWSTCAVSADGTRAIACIFGGGVYLANSTSGTLTWSVTAVTDTVVTSSPNKWWRASTMSSDGKVIALAEANTSPGGGIVYISNNYGANGSWTAINPASPELLTWYSIACSSDGTKMILCSTSGSKPFYISSDSGASWTPVSGSGSYTWASVSCSSDGQGLVALSQTAIFTSSNGGTSWTTYTTGMAGKSWRGIGTSRNGKKIYAFADSFKLIGSYA